MKKLRQLIRENKVALWLSAKAQSLQDQAGKNHTFTFTLLTWTNGRNGRAFKHVPTAVISVPASTASLSITEGVYIIFFDQPAVTGAVEDQFVTTAAGTGAVRTFSSLTSSTTLRFVAGATTSTIVYNWTGKRFLAVRFKQNTKPAFFVDGAWVGDGSLSLGADAAPNGITYLGGNNIDRYAKVPTSDFIILNSGDVTDEDIAKIYQELMEQQSAGDPKVRNYKWGVPKVLDSTLKIHTDFTPAAGYFTDLSGNNNTALYKGVSYRNDPVFGKVPKFNGVNSVAGYGAMNAKADLSIGTNDFSYGGWMNVGALATGYVCAAYSTTPIIYLATGATGTLSARYHDSGGVNVTITSAAGLVSTNKWYHVVVTGDRDGLMQIYLDGVSVKDGSIATGAANSLTTTNQLLLGANTNYASPAGFLDIALQDFRFYNGKALSATEIKNWYLEYADKPVLQAQPEYWLPTLANVSAGALSNTGFEVVSGSFKVSEDSSKKKWIEDVTAGAASALQTSAYGTWVGEVYCNTAGTVIWPFIATKKGSRDATGQNGYYFVITAAGAVALGISINGTPSSAMLSSALSYVAIQTVYKIAISRTLAGVFTLYIKGGAFTNWTLVTVGGSCSNPTAASTTYTTSLYQNAVGTVAGDKFRLLNIHQGVLGIPELSALY
jgi:hypothetical protein